MDRDGEWCGRPEGVVETGELRVRVHEDRVEVSVGQAHDALVVPGLVVAATHQDVADAAHDARPFGPDRVHRIEQWQQLELELLAAEGIAARSAPLRVARWQLVEDDAWPLAHRGLHRPLWIVADQFEVRVVTERRQVDDAYALGNLRTSAGTGHR